MLGCFREIQMSERKFCRKCLLEDMDENDFFRHLKEYIDGYPEEKRACEAVYKSRLAVCRSCDKLSNGMCEKCGCYVELRALKREMYCPDDKPKW